MAISQTGCTAEVSEPYALRVVGDSMAPEFHDGQIVIVDPGHPVRSGMYIVIDYGGEVIFGQFVDDQGRRWLEYLNPDREALALHPPYAFKGVVVQRVGRRRKDRKHYDYPATSAS